MNTNIERKFKWFWAWQDEKEELWLSEMAERGYHLDYIPFPCVYQFHRGEPAKYIYRLDYQALKTKDRESYLHLFADAGESRSSPKKQGPRNVSHKTAG